MSFDVISKYTFPKAGAARSRALVNNAISRSDLAKQLEITLEEVDTFILKNKAYLPPLSEKTVNIPCILGYTGISQLTLFEAIKQQSLISSPKTALVYTIISKHLTPIMGGFEVLDFGELFAPISRKYPDKKPVIMAADWITFVRKLSVPEGCVLHDTAQAEEIINDEEFIERVAEQSVRKAFQQAGTRLAVDRHLFEASAQYLLTGNRKLITDILKDKSYQYFNMNTRQIANRKKMYDVYHQILEDPQVILDDDEEYSLGTIALDTGSPPFYGYELSGLMLHPQIERAKARVTEVRLKAQQKPRTVGTLAQAGAFAERFKKAASIGPSKILEPKEPAKEDPKKGGGSPKGPMPVPSGPTPKAGPVGFVTVDEVNSMFNRVHDDAVRARGAEGIHIAWDDDLNHKNFKECETVSDLLKDPEFYALKCSCIPIPKNFSKLTIDQVNILLKFRGAIDDTGDNIRMLTQSEASMYLFSSDDKNWRTPDEDTARDKGNGTHYEYEPPQSAYSSAMKR